MCATITKELSLVLDLGPFVVDVANRIHSQNISMELEMPIVLLQCAGRIGSSNLELISTQSMP